MYTLRPLKVRNTNKKKRLYSQFTEQNHFPRQECDLVPHYLCYSPSGTDWPNHSDYTHFNIKGTFSFESWWVFMYIGLYRCIFWNVILRRWNIICTNSYIFHNLWIFQVYDKEHTVFTLGYITHSQCTNLQTKGTGKIKQTKKPFFKIFDCSIF